MGKTKATSDRVLEAAWTLLRQNEIVSPQSVQKQVGGSLGTIGPILRTEFWPAVSAAIGGPDPIPASLKRAVLNMLKEMQKTARAQIERELQDQIVAVERQQNAINEARKQLQREFKQRAAGSQQQRRRGMNIPARKSKVRKSAKKEIRTSTKAAPTRPKRNQRESKSRQRKR